MYLNSLICRKWVFRINFGKFLERNIYLSDYIAAKLAQAFGSISKISVVINPVRFLNPVDLVLHENSVFTMPDIPQ